MQLQPRWRVLKVVIPIILARGPFRGGVQRGGGRGGLPLCAKHVVGAVPRGVAGGVGSAIPVLGEIGAGRGYAWRDGGGGGIIWWW
jgi:hypothetical protein